MWNSLNLTGGELIKDSVELVSISVWPCMGPGCKSEKEIEEALKGLVLGYVISYKTYNLDLYENNIVQ